MPANSRYLLFVGNLAYTTTAEEIQNHFINNSNNKDTEDESKVNESKPPLVRISTDKKTKTPKGFAFVEFHNRKDFLSALKLHHSTLNGRKINVEKTVGGGGNSTDRKRKILAKNTMTPAKHKTYIEKRKGASSNNSGGDGKSRDVTKTK